MPLTTYTQIRLPLVTIGRYTYEIRINRNSYDFNVAASATLICDHFKYLFNESVQLVKELCDEDGDFTGDQLDMTVQDCRTVSGTVNAVPTTIDFGAEQTTLFEWLFADDTATYTVFFSRYVDGTDANNELCFVGDLDPLTITRGHTGTINPHTADAERLQNLTLNWSICAERLAKLTVADLVDTFEQSDMTNASVKKPFYGGTVANPDYSFFGSSPAAANFQNDDFGGLYVSDYPTYYQKASYGTALIGAWPRALWGVSLDKVCEKIADLAEFDHEAATDCMFAHYKPFYGEAASKGYYTGDRVMAVPGATPGSIQINYNIAFGVSPVDAEMMESPVSYKRDASVGSVIKDICLLTGCYPKISYDQTSKRPTLKLVSRTADEGELPTGLVLAASTEVERQVGKQRVCLNFRADDSVVSCPRQSGDSIDIEIPWRWRAWGTEEVIQIRHHIQNKKLSYSKQYINWTLTSPDYSRLESDGWLGGAYLYHYQSGTTNNFYPTGAGLSSSIEGSGSDWSGFYALTHYVYDGPSGEAPEPSVHPLESLARFYAHELLGNRSVLEREYIGVSDDDGNVSGIVPLMRITESIRSEGGATREFKAIRVVQNLSSDRTSITFLEVVDSANWEDAPVYINGDAGDSTGGTATSTSNGELIVPEIYLRLSPNNTEENTATAQSATVTPLTLIGAAAQSEELFDVQTDGGTQRFAVDSSGNVLLKPIGTSAGNTNELRCFELIANGSHYTGFKAPDSLAGNLMYIMPTTATDGYFLKWTTGGTLVWDSVSTSLTGALIIDPNNATRNTAQPTDATGKALRLLGHASQSANVFEVCNSAGTASIWSTSGGELHSNNNVHFDYAGVVYIKELEVESTGRFLHDGGSPNLVVIGGSSQANNLIGVETNGGTTQFRIDQNFNTGIGPLSSISFRLHLDGSFGLTSEVVAIAGGAATNINVTKSCVNLNPGAGSSVTGINSPVTDQMIRLVNQSTNNLTITHNNANLAGDFFCPGNGNYTLQAREAIWATYNPANQRWHIG
jgi:hypothetical protein